MWVSMSKTLLSTALFTAFSYIIGTAKPTFDDDVFPILENLCLDCHDEDVQKGNLRIDNLNPDMVKGPDADRWHEVLNKLNVGEMPPVEKTQPTDKDREILTGWLNTSLAEAAKARRATDGRVVFRRLNREEYNNTLNDLFGLDLDIQGLLPSERPSEAGFTNNGQELFISPLHLEYFLKIARMYVRKAIVSGKRPPRTGFHTTIEEKLGKPAKDGKNASPSTPIPISFKLEDPEKPASIGMQLRRKHAAKGFRMVYPDSVLLPPGVRSRGTGIPARQGPQPALQITPRDFPDEGAVRIRVTASAQDPILPDAVANLDTTGAVYLEVYRPHLPGGATQDAYKNANPVEVRFVDGITIKGIGVDIEEVSLRYSTLLEVPESGKYKFHLSSDDGSCLYINSELLASTYNSTKVSDEIELEAGSHKMVLNYYDSGGGDRLSLEWEGPGIGKQPVRSLKRDPDILPQKKQIESKREKQYPSIAVRMGNFLDDGLELKALGSPQEVRATQDKPQTYDFLARLENLPLPFRNKDLGNRGDLNRALILISNAYYPDSVYTDPILRIHSIEFEAPFYPTWPTESHRKIFPGNQGEAADITTARQIFQNFLRRAYRRPPTNKEAGDFMDLWKAYRANPGIPEGDELSFEDSIAAILPAALVSPAFLYLVEPSEDGKNRELNSYEIASRLSYFLWSTMPDKELSDLADQSKLADPAILRKQVHRLLASGKSEAFYRNFIDQWLELDALERVAIDRKRYPDYQPYLREAMRKETRGFFKYILEEGISALHLIDSEFLWINPLLAKHYNIQGVRGEKFRKVPAPQSHIRGGILTHASILTANSSGTDSHPIKRGTWLLKKLLNSPPPPPPPNVPELDQEDPDLRGKSIKEQLELHRENPACMNCHKKIDPFGIPFETYDTVGKHRTHNKGKPVDSIASLPDGTQIANLQALQDYLLTERKDQFAQALTHKLLAYALGRTLSFADEPETQKISQKFESEGYRLKSLIEEIVLSDAFLLK